MTGLDPFILFGVILALALNFVNGLNDASHSIATVVATKALSPIRAVFSTAICNMIGPFLFSTAVAVTIGTEIVKTEGLTPLSLIVTMLTSIFLVFVATRMGIPVSSSHAMVGALIGTAIGVGGFTVIIPPSPGILFQVFVAACIGAVIGAAVLGMICAAFEGDVRLGILLGAVFGAGMIIPFLMIAGVIHLQGLFAIILFIFIGPLIGMAGAFLLNVLVTHLIRHAHQNRAKRTFQPLHIGACLIQATAHGANDGQHAVGLITALLVSSGILVAFEVPTWVILASAVAIGLGTCFGGWKVVDKMAKEITKIRPYQGFCAATASSAILVMVTRQGIPVSSTQAINGSIVGVGATRGRTAVQWEVVREMMIAWVITIPLALALSWIVYEIITQVLTVF
ncbi:MAG: inorganic phosphate transporter [Methanoregula sp.]|nr:inorganic phosphate transporter [Methanoregula sp.]